MNFFAHQDQARRNTVWLVSCYFLAMLGITLLIYALTTAIISGVEYDAHLDASERSSSESSESYETSYSPAPATTSAKEFNFSFWNLERFALVILGVGLFMGGATLFKVAQLSSGGGAMIAQQLGGREVLPNTTNAQEKRLYNIVEEMSIASGVPVPSVFVMDNEAGINAFAAGYTPQNAVVAVTRGTLETLSRDELQGVVAHEFSHILNGDMRLNIRLLGTLFGLEVIVLIGWGLIRAAGHMSIAQSSSKDKGGGVIIFFTIGAALMVIGFIGIFFSGLIRAAISRQREFLADASAVQFTRNPNGIAGALQKIAAGASRIENEHAAEMGHFFFGESSSLSSLWATHPPLPERIRRVLALPLTTATSEVFSQSESPKQFTPSAENQPRNEKQNASIPRAVFPAANAVTDVVGRIGTLQISQIMAAATMLESLDTAARDAAHDGESAMALILSLLIADNESEKNTAREENSKENSLAKSLANSLGNELAQRVFELQKISVSRAARVPLVQSSLAAIRQVSPERYRQFRLCAEEEIRRAPQTTLFAYTVRGLLQHDLDVRFGIAPPTQIKWHSLKPLAEAMTLILSVAARRGHEDIAEAQMAFAAAQKSLGLALSLPLPDDTTFEKFSEATDKIAAASPILIDKFLRAVCVCVAHDGKITERETEILRALCAAFGCPLPS